MLAYTYAYGMKQIKTRILDRKFYSETGISLTYPFISESSFKFEIDCKKTVLFK